MILALILATLLNSVPKEANLSKLTLSERTILESWVQNNFSKKDAKKKKPELQENLRGGLYIRLTDNTLWEVNPADTPITQGWITQVEIEVTQSSTDPNYPYLLKNTLTGSSVHARQATTIPTNTK